MENNSDGLTQEEIGLLPVGWTILDKAGVEWVQTSPGRWWDKSYPSDTEFELSHEDRGGMLYYRYSPFRIRG